MYQSHIRLLTPTIESVDIGVGMEYESVGYNLLAKCYANECDKLLETAVKRICPGCIQNKLEQIYHVVCKSERHEQVFYCVEILIDLFNEKNVTHNLLVLLSQLGWSHINLSKDLFDIAQRRRELSHSYFWELIAQYMTTCPTPCIPTMDTEDIGVGIMSLLRDRILKIFNDYEIPYVIETINELVEMSYFGQWVNDSVFRSWATELDKTQLFYMLPERYEALKQLTGATFPAIPVVIGKVNIVLLGVTSKVPRFGPWVNSRMIKRILNSNLDFDEGVLAELKFAMLLQNYVDSDSEYYWQMKKAFDASMNWFRLHRKVVNRVFKALMLDDMGHDLTKDPLVQVALGYIWYYPQELRNNKLMDAANDVIRFSHFHKESHYMTSTKKVNLELLFADSLAYHLQNTEKPLYQERGFDVASRYIPAEAKDQWDTFKSIHRCVNLWDWVYDILPCKIDIDTDVPTKKMRLI